MSDSEPSTVTYTSVSFPVKDDSDISSPGVDGPPIMQRTNSLIRAAYEVDPEEDDEDPEEDPADYPADGDDDDDKDEDEDEEEEEEHPAPADSVPPIHRRVASCLNPPTTSHLVHYRLHYLRIPSPPPNSPTHIEIPESCLPLWTEDIDLPIARDVPYSIEREDLYGTLSIMVDVPPRCFDVKGVMDFGITDTGMIWDRPVNGRLAVVMIEREREGQDGLVRLWGLSMDPSDYARSDVYAISNYGSGAGVH
ncbi:hypothetical protein Tco_1429231 [Tanacetum coccineum]